MSDNAGKGKPKGKPAKSSVMVRYLGPSDVLRVPTKDGHVTLLRDGEPHEMSADMASTLKASKRRNIEIV